MRPSLGEKLVAAAALGCLGAGIAAWATIHPGPPREGGDGRAVQAAASHPTPTVARVAASPRPSLIITLRRSTVYAARPGSHAAGSLAATNPFGQQQVLAVVGSPRPDGWVEVELPIRPNGSVGWIRTAGGSLTETNFRVSVSVEARTLTVHDGARTVLTTPVAVGAPGTPTPAGRTYLWELIRPDNPAGAYGPYIFGLAMYSTAYSVFNGGDAQIGIHGQDEPWSIGKAASHGCVRLPNAVITELARMLPLGTPVSIS